ncbi:ATP-binding cassette domain-containing protein [Candidatus Bipolaricaulota bacterium]|nr:ATP-binding cassette domain-containing protein [Candidatus Bipolaricaulota bacterium]
MSKIVQVAELSIYDEEDEAILENLSFNLERGKMARLSGLTERQYDVLFHVLTGEISPDSGQVVLSNRNVVRLSRNKRKKMLRDEVSFLPKDFTLPGEKTALQSLQFKQEITGPVRDPDEQLEETLQLLELTGEGKRAKKFDSLMRVKTALALAIINQPEVLICYRSFSALNSSEVSSVIEVLSKLNEQKNLTILLLTDDLSDSYKSINVIESNLDSRVVGTEQ